MAKGIAYKGDVYLRRYVNGVLSNNIIGAIGGTKLTIKANADLKERFGKGRDNHGLLVGSVALSKPSDITVGFNEVTPEMMAIVFMGTNAALSSTGGTVTAEPITLVQNQWVKTANRNISASTITGLVLGTDFIEHKRLGAIMAKTATAVGLKSINYTYSAITGNRISGGVASQVDVEIVFDGVNLEDNSDAYVRIPKITLTPKTDIDLLSGDYINAEMAGKAIKLPNETGEIIFDDAVAYA